MINVNYERDGGFREELRLIREIGAHITALQETVQTRVQRASERLAIHHLSTALEAVRSEITGDSRRSACY